MQVPCGTCEPFTRTEHSHAQEHVSIKFPPDNALHPAPVAALSPAPLSVPAPLHSHPTPHPQLATEFRLRSAEVVERLQSLEAQGQLTGVMDERGKFIHISTDEMRAVADFIRRRGRVAIGELAAKSGGCRGACAGGWSWRGARAGGPDERSAALHAGPPWRGLEQARGRCGQRRPLPPQPTGRERMAAC